MTGLPQGWEKFLPQSGDENFRPRFAAALADQVVCVAGAGGYIGSALAKALAHEGPRSLILLDSAEYGLFKLQREMESAQTRVPCEYVLGSIDDDQLLDRLFSRLRPQVIFHAAAFKHVGLLERNPFTAIRNNALGSYALLKAAQRHGVSKFLLVSTDKAAHPHSVMGVSKRIAELFALSYRANAIRLGNVIGSTGSVIPIFLEQIEKGQPLSVTHPEASRYFLSINETVTAILAANSARCEGKILLPKLGEAVRIAELAAFLGPSSPICFTGLRPGEKITEDLIGRDERPFGTIDGPLTVVESAGLSTGQGLAAVDRLSACLANRDGESLLETLRELVPDYEPSNLMRESCAVVSYK